MAFPTVPSQHDWHVRCRIPVGTPQDRGEVWRHGESDHSMITAGYAQIRSKSKNGPMELKFCTVVYL